MNSYKCPQCGLLNWATADQCKRCRLPNAPNVPQQFQPQPVMPNTVIAATPHTAVQMPFASAPNYQTPPQFQYERAGSYSPNNAPHYSNNYQPQTTYDVDDEEIAKAEKQVKAGAVAGGIWTVLLGLGTFAILFLYVRFPDLQKVSPNPADAAKFNEMFSTVIIGIMGFMTLLIGGLTEGIRKKNMACTVILAVIAILGIIESLPEKNIGSIVFGSVMFVFFARAAVGISTLKKYGLID
jgi:hypothetical protein